MFRFALPRVLAVLCLILAVSAAPAHARDWEITVHSTNQEQMQSDVSSRMRGGLLPVGLSFIKGSPTILYIRDTILNPTAWLLEPYASTKDLEKGLNDMGTLGYRPTGLSYTGGRYFVFYIKDDIPYASWAVIPSELSLEGLKQAIKPYVSKGFIPYGLGSNNSQFLVLLLETNLPHATSYMLESYPLDEDKASPFIDQRVAQGYKPWGFLHHGSQVFLLYLKY